MSHPPLLIDGSMRRRSSNTLEVQPAFLSGLFLTHRAKQSAGIAAVLCDCQLRLELAGGTHPEVSHWKMSHFSHKSPDRLAKWASSELWACYIKAELPWKIFGQVYLNSAQRTWLSMSWCFRSVPQFFPCSTIQFSFPQWKLSLVLDNYVPHL